MAPREPHQLLLNQSQNTGKTKFTISFTSYSSPFQLPAVADKLTPSTITNWQGISNAKVLYSAFLDLVGTLHIFAILGQDLKYQSTKAK